MTRRCFFVQRIDPGVGSIHLSLEASHHVENVLRRRVGDRIEIRDGFGNGWVGEISELKKGSVAVRLLAQQGLQVSESPVNIMLALGLARSEVMDLAVRQATENGVCRLIAFRAARSRYGLTGRQADKKIERWSKIAAEAMCQCGRGKMPEIALFPGLDEFLRSLTEKEMGDETLKIFAWERGMGACLSSFRESRPRCSHIVAAIGPEGGWEDSEASRLTGAGFASIHLGPRILRFETAAVALISSIQLLWGDLGQAQEKEGHENEMH